MRISFLIVMFLLLTITAATANTLKPFTSDGCSMFPDGNITDSTLWLSCCQQHDLAYWQGGTYQQRLVSDQALRQCVAKLDQPQIALLMMLGVRLGGTPYLPTSFRWGYGWPYPRAYGKLTKEELAQVNKLIPKY